MQHKPLRGVNLGGWLVLEKWITPSLFEGTDAIDEYTFCKNGGKANLHKLMEFREHFITKQDFVWLAGQGIGAVRLPIGYWAFGSTAPFLPTVTYIDRAFRWAKETGLKILLDLHGAPGSQNGRDHSGQSGGTTWHQDKTNIAAALAIVQQLGDRYGKLSTLLGISVLNEPSSTIPKSVLLDYYEQAYITIRRTCGDNVWMVYDDGYMPKRWREELPVRKYKNVFIDTHHYQVFAPIDKLPSVKFHLLRTHLQLPHKLNQLLRHHPVIIGEWSLALDSNILQRMSANERTRIAQQYAQAQLKAYQTSAAWFFWTYKMEYSGAWSFRDCAERGLLPY